METENFDQLKKLLALKRHEQPPPGYFDTFSSKVTARIQAAEAAAPKTWWQKLAGAFDAKPIMVSAYGVAVMGMLAFVVTFSAKTGQDASPALANQKTPSVTATPALNTELASQPLNVAPTATLVVASNSSAPSFLFSPNGALENGSLQQAGATSALPVNYKATSE